MSRSATAVGQAFAAAATLCDLEAVAIAGGFSQVAPDYVDQVRAAAQAAGAPRECMLLETSRPGVLAAGDVRSGSIKRVASAVGEGAMAVRLVHEHLTALGRAPAQTPPAQT